MQLYETFGQSLARQFRGYGKLSPKQAACAVKMVFGRRNKANGDKFDDTQSFLEDEQVFDYETQQPVETKPVL